MKPQYQIGDPVPVLGACGHDLTVEHILIPKPGDADDARYYALLCFTPGCERRYGWRGDDETPRALNR